MHLLQVMMVETIITSSASKKSTLMPCFHGMFTLQVNIPAAYLSSNMEWTEQQEILRDLNSDGSKYKFLYVTPEKVAKCVLVISFGNI